MDRIRDKNRESAQGMVEFALVLPILLLVILGIFAFGHMFFAYTSIVSASREAARFGAVVGVSSSGVLRYRDCAGIRGSAENIAKYVGVAAVETTDGFEGEDPGIFIGYDGGPNTSVYNTCPEGGLGPNNVNLGDRILVRVSIDYEPIVPLVNIPSFPLTATTARTIIKDVPVGQAPTAMPSTSCMETKIEILDPADLSELVVGQEISPLIQVSVDDPFNPSTQPNGTVTIMAPDAASPVLCEEINVPNGSPFDSNCFIRYDMPVSTSTNVIQAIFNPAVPDEQCGPVSVEITHSVRPADTTIAIDQITPMPYRENRTVNVRFRFGALSPGIFYPTPGTITVNAAAGTSSFNCTVNTSTLSGPDGSDQYTAACDLGSSNSFVRGETYTVTASYGGSVGYNPSTSGSIPYVIPLEPTDPPVEPTEPPVESTPDPNCPYFASPVFNFPGNNTSFWINVVNPNVYNFDLNEVAITWPAGSSTPLLMSTYFDPYTTAANPCSNSACLWQAQNKNGYLLPNPPPRVLSANGPMNWNKNKDFLSAGQTKQILFTFTENLTASGSNAFYELTLRFSSGSTICNVKMSQYR